MGNPYFHFKQFEIRHDRCAMKVGTDGVLLGSWAIAHLCPNKILDIGTGSGLVALMMAQRYKTSFIHAIEVDTVATGQAAENFAASPWANRLYVKAISLQDYVLLCTDTYDLIVSNPPFFTHSLKAPDLHRNIARHNDLLPPDQLVAGAATLLSDQGVLCVILPTTDEERFCTIARTYHLFPQRITRVHPTPEAMSKRSLMAFGKQELPIQIDRLDIETGGRHKYSDEYQHLTADFYLNK